MMCTSGRQRVPGGLYRTLPASCWPLGRGGAGLRLTHRAFAAASTQGLSMEPSARAPPAEPGWIGAHSLPRPVSWAANSQDNLTGQQRPCFLHQKASCMISHAFQSQKLKSNVCCYRNLGEANFSLPSRQKSSRDPSS